MQEEGEEVGGWGAVVGKGRGRRVQKQEEEEEEAEEGSEGGRGAVGREDKMSLLEIAKTQNTFVGRCFLYL